MRFSIAGTVTIAAALLLSSGFAQPAPGTVPATPPDSLLGSGVHADLEQIPSAFWPLFVHATVDLPGETTSSGKPVRSGSRGTLLRIEGNALRVDFGRAGIALVPAGQTDFFERLLTHMKKEEVKQFANLTQQLGTKLMAFGRGEQSGAIRFTELWNTQMFLILYLDQYEPKMAWPLHAFADPYRDLTRHYPEIVGVLIPQDREFYDFAFTVDFPVPLIAPHMRKGYIHSLAHEPPAYPYLVAIDPNGRVLYKSEAGFELERLTKEVENAVRSVGYNWSAPYTRERNANVRSASWMK